MRLERVLLVSDSKGLGRIEVGGLDAEAERNSNGFWACPYCSEEITGFEFMSSQLPSRDEVKSSVSEVVSDLDRDAGVILVPEDRVESIADAVMGLLGFGE